MTLVPAKKEQSVIEGTLNSWDSDVQRVHLVNAWNRRFSARTIQLNQDDDEPFKPGKMLGKGGFGLVHETKLDGIAVALKRTYAKRIREQDLNEMQVLHRMSEKHHRHIVDLIGSYVRELPRITEVGLLIWPVADIDLAEFLRELDVLVRHSEYKEQVDAKDLNCTLQALRFLINDTTSELDANIDTIHNIISLGRDRLRSSFVCIAEALRFLRDQNIRHKDLKPSQILISRNGLWLTDFGWAKDMTGCDQSLTSGGDNTTVKYEAPERASGKACSRSEDVFALGCIFLEMSYCVWPRAGDSRSEVPWLQARGWSFQASLDQVCDLIDHLPISMNRCQYPSSTCRVRLREMLKSMLAVISTDRPRIETVLQTLLRFGPRSFSKFGHISGSCCVARDIPGPDASTSKNNHTGGTIAPVEMPLIKWETETSDVRHLLRPIWARVPRCGFSDDQFRFLVECQLEDGTHWELQRRYTDFYHLQTNLIATYPVEAGTCGSGSMRTLPFIPRPCRFVRHTITSNRRCLDLYLVRLLKLGWHITDGPLVKSFFASREGDKEIDPSSVSALQ